MIERMTLRALRINKNMKQTDLACAVGVSRDSVSSWERGITKPTVDKITLICEALEVGYDDIQWNV